MTTLSDSVMHGWGPAACPLLVGSLAQSLLSICTYTAVESEAEATVISVLQRYRRLPYHGTSVRLSLIGPLTAPLYLRS